MSERFDHASVYVALLAAWIAMLGSLYFSEVLGYVPCTLCWYQRILMYPLAAILAVGLLRRDQEVPFLVLPFSLLGMGVSGYHYLLQKTDLFDTAATCTVGSPCTTIWVNWMGFVTIPFLALTAFTIITLMMLVAYNSGLPDPEIEGTPWLPVVVAIAAVALVFGLLALLNRDDAAAQIAGQPTGQTAIQAAAPSSAGSATPKLSLAVAEGEASATYDGKQIYLASCAACHGQAGEGVAGLGAPFVDSELWATGSDEEILVLVRTGIPADDPANRTGVPMPPSGGRPDLSDDELLAVLAYLRQNDAGD